MLEHPSPLEAPRNSTFSITVSLLDMLAVLEILCSSAEEQDQPLLVSLLLTAQAIIKRYSIVFSMTSYSHLTTAVKMRLAKTLFLRLVYFTSDCHRVDVFSSAVILACTNICLIILLKGKTL